MDVAKIPGRFLSNAYGVIGCIRGLFQRYGNFTARQTKTRKPYKRKPYNLKPYNKDHHGKYKVDHRPYALGRAI